MKRNPSFKKNRKRYVNKYVSQLEYDKHELFKVRRQVRWIEEGNVNFLAAKFRHEYTNYTEILDAISKVSVILGTATTDEILKSEVRKELQKAIYQLIVND